jgi:hypothetical protein
MSGSTRSRMPMVARACWVILLAVCCSVSAQTALAQSSARVASATNAESTCPLWSGLDTEGKPTGKSPQAILISRRQLGSGPEWEVSARPTQAGLVLYSGVVELESDQPPFGFQLLRLVWMHPKGRELVARFPLGAGRLFRTVACGHHPTVLPPHTRYTGKGSSCQRPLKSYYLRDKEKAGDTKDMPIISGPGSPPADFFIGRHVQPPEVTDYEVVHVTSNSRVIICHIELVIYEDPNGTTVRHYQLPTGPHGSKPTTIGDTEGSFKLTVEGRYSSGRP